MLQADRWQEGKHSPGREMHASLREDYLNQVQRDFLSQIASKSDVAPLAETPCDVKTILVLTGPGNSWLSGTSKFKGIDATQSS